MIIWAMLWTPLGIASGIVEYSHVPPYDLILDIDAPPQYPPAFPIIARNVLTFAIWGAAVGLFFSVMLLGAERNRTIHELSAYRFATWGAVASAGLPLVLVIIDLIQSNHFYFSWGFISLLLLVGMFGAICALGMLRVAQRASS
jgi:hypothetical protein